MDFPVLMFAVSLTVLCLATLVGARISKKREELDDDDRADLSTILTAALTLLGLIIGFTFSMAVTRYNQRKDYEATEANTIGTEYARAELMPAGDTAKVRELLRRYLNQRISFYRTSDIEQVAQINASTAELQIELWSAVRKGSSTEPAPIAALILSGMTEVLNTQGYAQAAWWNHIPNAAWVLTVTIAVCCGGLMGYTAHRPEKKTVRLFVLPVLLSITFFLIADIDSPTGGVIGIHPRDLESLARSMALRNQM